MTKTTLYALDFDGVICDSAIETAITGWKTASKTWNNMPEEIPDEMIDLFRQVRPAMETGYEAALIMRHLFEGIHPDMLLASFESHLRHLIKRDEMDISRLKDRFGNTRDIWIEENQDEWIAVNPLFDGIRDKLLQTGDQSTMIITTKQERFVQKILLANNIGLPADRIYGLDRQLSKQQILADLLVCYPDHDIIFVEDRLPTLLKIIDDDRLDTIKLYFADWGYNTVADKKSASLQDRISRITLDQFKNL